MRAGAVHRFTQLLIAVALSQGTQGTPNDHRNAHQVVWSSSEELLAYLGEGNENRRITEICVREFISYHIGHRGTIDIDIDASNFAASPARCGGSWIKTEVVYIM